MGQQAVGQRGRGRGRGEERENIEEGEKEKKKERNRDLSLFSSGHPFLIIPATDAQLAAPRPIFRLFSVRILSCAAAHRLAVSLKAKIMPKKRPQRCSPATERPLQGACAAPLPPERRPAAPLYSAARSRRRRTGQCHCGGRTARHARRRPTRSPVVDRTAQARDGAARWWVRAARPATGSSRRTRHTHDRTGGSLDTAGLSSTMPAAPPSPHFPSLT